jgi:hypothetical protein
MTALQQELGLRAVSPAQAAAVEAFMGPRYLSHANAL